MLPYDRLEKLLRAEWWKHHGCSPIQLYGDDGEMQCAQCVTDFKRMPLDELEVRVDHLRWIALARASAIIESEGKREPNAI